MKRVVICSVLLLCLIAVSIYAHIKVERLGEVLDLRIEALTAVLHDNNEKEIIEQSNALVEFWKGEEEILVHLVRHSHIDIISVSVARMPALAEYGEYAEVYAELLSIRKQMEHIRSAEILTFENLL